MADTETLELDFSQITGEIRSVVGRRRELMIFLGSLFAAMGISLQNVLEGNLPEALEPFERHAFLGYAIAVFVPSLVIALRIARLHGGMVLNGIFYARLLSETDSHYDPKRSARLNMGGVSTQFFLLNAALCAFAAALLTISIDLPLVATLATGGLVFVGLMLAFRHFHFNAARFALGQIEGAKVEPVSRDILEDHLAASLQDVNHDMIAIVSFVGLMLFSGFECLSGLGNVQAGTDLSRTAIEHIGPVVYALLLLLSTVMGSAIYVRLRLAVGHLSIQIDPTDRPFRPFRLTDSFLGYCLLAFFLLVALHLTLFPFRDTLGSFLWVLEGLAIVACLGGYQAALIAAGRHRPRRGA